APAVQALAARDPRLAERVLPGHPVTRAELLWALRHEGALDAADLLDRRTRIGVVPEDRAAALDTVRDLVAETGGTSGTGETSGGAAGGIEGAAADRG
ncbi:hypothetical protein G3I36_27760, partial [Streptomyces sp. SID10362]|uniref:glycerol-3-phosphate dehydrogenase C-terminal domain-containing protein n=1 Tax=Streptomyces sp. SID10362 TaxID=2706021 RepID=UPI0013CBE4CB